MPSVTARAAKTHHPAITARRCARPGDPRPGQALPDRHARRSRASRWTIEEGEFFGLLGPNGAGKSTLIHCTTGLAQPTGGTIEIFGHDAVNHYTEARMAVGLAPQELNLDWFLTLEESLDYHGGYFGMSRKDRRERARELLDDVLAARQEGRAHALPVAAA